MPLNALPKWEETVAQLHSAALSMGNDSLSVQKPAEAVFEQFAEEMNGALEKVPENSKSFLLRWPTLAEKIAGVLHMIDYASHLSLHDALPIYQDGSLVGGQNAANAAIRSRFAALVRELEGGGNHVAQAQ